MCVNYLPGPGVTPKGGEQLAPMVYRSAHNVVNKDMFYRPEIRLMAAGARFPVPDEASLPLSLVNKGHCTFFWLVIDAGSRQSREDFLVATVSAGMKAPRPEVFDTKTEIFGLVPTVL